MKFISHLFSFLVLTGLAAACGVALLVVDITRDLPDYREQVITCRFCSMSVANWQNPAASTNAQYFGYP